MSICDGCIHDDVCGLEDNHEEGIVSCADRIPKDVLDKIRAEIESIDTVEVKIYDWVNIIKSPQRIKNEVLDIIDKYKSESEAVE